MKQPDETHEYHGVEIKLLHNWLTLQWGVAFGSAFVPGFESKEDALAHAKRMIDRDTLPIARKEQNRESDGDIIFAS